MDRIEGRTAFITGGARGIGLGIARAFAREGTKLALVDIDEAALNAARTELGVRTSVETFVLDVRDREAYARVADEVEARLGPVSILCNNAGVAASADVAHMTYELWDWVMGINLNGVINGIQTLVPRMIEHKIPAHIVNTASGAGLIAEGSGLQYATSKFAVVGLSEGLRWELERFGIGVSVLCPGPVATSIIPNTLAFPGRQPHRDDARRDRDERQKDGASLCLAGHRRCARRGRQNGAGWGEGQSAVYTHRPHSRRCHHHADQGRP
jgi:NAD(P)-dependent dehydrogenase (short-subunit alcohol dehydrogenase family)